MEAVVLVIHLIVALAIIASVMLQRSEGGGLGIGGGGLGNFAGQRSTADFMTRLTAVLGAIFVVTSLLLAILATYKTETATGSILDMKSQDASVIQQALDAEMSDSGVDNSMDTVNEAPVDGVIAVPPSPAKIVPAKVKETTEKPSAPVSK